MALSGGTRAESQPTTVGGQGRRARLVTAIAAACLAAVGVFGHGFAAVHADSTGTLVPEGSIKFGTLGPNPAYTMILDPGLDRGYMAVADTTPSVLRVFDLSRKTAIRDVNGPSGMSTFGQGLSSLPFAVVDTDNHTIIFFDIAGGQCGGLAILDEIHLTWHVVAQPCLPNGDTWQDLSMTYDSASRMFYIFGSDLNQQQNADTVPFLGVDHYMRGVDPVTGKMLWEAKLPACGSNGGSIAPYDTPGFARSGDQLIVTCWLSDNGGNNRTIVVRVPLGPNGRPAVDASGSIVNSFTAPSVGVDLAATVDPVRGDVILVSTQTGYELGSYVQDARDGMFRGFVATGGDTSFNGPDSPRTVGLDQLSGRLYMRTTRGIVLADTRHDPVPSGLAYLGAPYAQRDGADGLQLTVDGTRHLIYVPDLASKSYLVFLDTVPPSPDDLPTNFDAATVNVPEAPGVTGVTFSASGNAYGGFLLSEGGPSRIVDNLDSKCPPTNDNVESAPLVGPTASAAETCPENAVVTPGDRTWYLGHVAQLSVTNLGANASAGAVDMADSATSRDFERSGLYGAAAPSPLPSPSPAPPTVAGSIDSSGVTDFPFDRPQDRPECQDFGTKAADNSESSVVGQSKVTCDLSQGKATGDSTVSSTAGTPAAASQQLSSALDGGSFEAHASSVRDRGLGMVTTASATARNITIPVPGAPAIFIGSVHVEATSMAHGRPGTASASFRRVITDFNSPSYQCTTSCDPAKVTQAIDQDFQSHGMEVFAFAPQPDGSFYPKGTPGGFQAEVTKDARLQTSENSVNDDPTDTVAGLEIMWNDDGSAGRTREIIQLAGVHVESHYGIYLLSADSGDVGGGSASTSAGAPSATTDQASTVSSTSTDSVLAPVVSAGKNRLPAVIRAIGDVIEQAWRLLVTDPKTAAMLAGLWALLLTPVYLAVRRRSLVSQVSRGMA